MTTHQLAHVLLKLPDTKLALGTNNHTSFHTDDDRTGNDLVHIADFETSDGPRIIVANYHKTNEQGGNPRFGKLLYREPWVDRDLEDLKRWASGPITRKEV